LAKARWSGDIGRAVAESCGRSAALGALPDAIQEPGNAHFTWPVEWHESCFDLIIGDVAAVNR
jgi:hypothetical protein